MSDDVAAVLVHIDLQGDRPHPASLQALAAGRQVASSWGATLYAALIVHDPSPGQRPGSPAAPVRGIEAAERRLARAGADKIVVAVTDAPIAPLWGAVGGAWQAVLDQLRPRVVLFGADAPSAAELAARTGARIGARLLHRARALGGDEIELRDRDGTAVRASDGGAAVATIGRADPLPAGDEDVDLVVIAAPNGADPRVELAGASPADVAQIGGALIVLGDELAASTAVCEGAKKLAARLGARLVGGTAAVRAGAVPAGATVEPATPLAPELCIAIGAPRIDLAGASALVKIGAAGGKHVDGALADPAEAALDALDAALAALATAEGA